MRPLKPTFLLEAWRFLSKLNVYNNYYRLNDTENRAFLYNHGRIWLLMYQVTFIPSVRIRS